MKTDHVRVAAERMGLTLSDNDAAVIREKWESDPCCNLDDLLSGIRRLQEKRVEEIAAITNSMILAARR